MFEHSVFGTDSSNIRFVDNFIEENDIESVLKYAATIDQWNFSDQRIVDNLGNVIYSPEDWADTTCGFDMLEKDNFYVACIIMKYASLACSLAETFFSTTLSFRHPPLVRRTPKNLVQAPHCDKQNLDGSLKLGMENYDISAIIYYNDDYEGGEIAFPQHYMKIKPKRGSIIVFPGDYAYLHYVEKVHDGVRWSTPLFMSVSETSGLIMK